MDDKKEKEIYQMIAEAYIEANTKHQPTFNSSHEGFAVLLEELEELKDEIVKIEKLKDSLWEDVKADYYWGQKDNLTAINKNIPSVINEALHVGAMAYKFLKYLNAREGDKA
jgi:hypothetical protein